MSERKIAAPLKKKQKSADFINNAALLAEIIASKKVLRENPDMLPAQAITPALAEMFKLLVEKFSVKKNWSGYSYVDESRADAIVNLVAKWHKFDETKWTNPFAFYTQVMHNCFLGTLGREKKQQRIKDAILESRGMLPSFRRQSEYAESLRSEAEVPVEEEAM